MRAWLVTVPSRRIFPAIEGSRRRPFLLKVHHTPESRHPKESSHYHMGKHSLCVVKQRDSMFRIRKSHIQDWFVGRQPQ